METPAKPRTLERADFLWMVARIEELHPRDPRNLELDARLWCLAKGYDFIRFFPNEGFRFGYQGREFVEHGAQVPDYRTDLEAAIKLVDALLPDNTGVKLEFVSGGWEGSKSSAQVNNTVRWREAPPAQVLVQATLMAEMRRRWGY